MPRTSSTRGQALLREILPACVQAQGLRTVLDAGCGVGYFPPFCATWDLKFRCLMRSQNVEEARLRHAGITFSIANMEDPALQKLGQFDPV